MENRPMQFESKPDEALGSPEKDPKIESLPQASNTPSSKEAEEEKERKIAEIQQHLAEGATKVPENNESQNLEQYTKPRYENFVNLAQKVDTFFGDFEKSKGIISISDEAFWSNLEQGTEEISKAVQGRFPIVYLDRPQRNSQGIVEYPTNTRPFSDSPVLGDNPVFMEVLIRDSFNQLAKDGIVKPEQFEAFRDFLFLPIVDKKFSPDYVKADKDKILEAQKKAWKEITSQTSKKEIVKKIKERGQVLYAVYALGTDKESFITDASLKSDESLRAAAASYRAAAEKQGNVWDHDTPRVSLQPSLSQLKRFWIF